MESWDRLIRALGPAADRLRLRAPATELALRAAEQAIGRPLPADYRAWLAIADGQEIGGLSLLPNSSWFISVDRLIARYQEDRAYDLTAAEIDTITVTMDRDRIRHFVFHPQRVTIAGAEHLDYDNYLIDGIPGPSGTIDQLIVFVTECDLVVVAQSLAAFFDRAAELVESGQLTPRPDLDSDGEALQSSEPGVWNRLARGEKPRRPRNKPKR